MDVYCYGTGADTCSQKPSLKISGGAFSADVSQYAADGYTVVQTGEKYVVQALTAENAVAQVGSQFYDTLDKAFSCLLYTSTWWCSTSSTGKNFW